MTRRHAAVRLVLLGAAALALTVAAAACGGGNGEPAAPAAGAAPAPQPQVELATESEPALEVTTHSVARIDAESNELVALVEVGPKPVAIAAGVDAVWTANLGDGTVTRIDAETSTATASIKLGGLLTDIAAGAGSAWAVGSVQGEATLTEILGTGELGLTVPLGLDDTRGVSIGHGAVWVTAGDLTGGAFLVRVDPVSGELAATIPLPRGGDQISISDDAVWMAATTTGPQSLEDWLMSVDPATNQVQSFGFTDALDLPSDVAATGGQVRLLGANTLVEFDPSSGEVVNRVEVGANPRRLVVGDAGVWIADSGDRTVVRVDPETNAIVATIEIGGKFLSAQAGPVLDIDAVDGAVWVSVPTQ